MNFIPFRDRFVWVSILVRKRLDLSHVLEVHFGRKRVWVSRHKRTTYKFIFGVFMVLEYKKLNFRKFRDRLLWGSILVRKWLDLLPVLEV